MSPDTPAQTPRRGPHHRSRVLGTLSLAGVLSFAGFACTSSSSTGTRAGTSTGSKAGTTMPSSSETSAKARFKFKTLDAGGPLTVKALEDGTIDIAELFSFSPEIAANNWVTLNDDKHLQSADNFVPLIRTESNTPAVGAVIDAVNAKLTHDNIMAMVTSVSIDGKNPEDVASKWLESEKLPGSLKATGNITVGSANFAESEIVGRIYAGALQSAGMHVTFKDAVGSRQVTTPMMIKGDLDLMPEFTYSLLAYFDSSAKPSGDLATVTAALEKALPKGLSIRKPTDVSDVNVFVVTRQTAKKYHLKNLSDLAGVASPLTLGGPPECPKNAACLPGLKSVYGLRFTIL